MSMEVDIITNYITFSRMNRENMPNCNEYHNEGLEKWTENAILTTTTKPPRHAYAMCGMVNAS